MSQIEAGRYAATIKSAEVTETKNGKAQVSFSFTLENGQSFSGNKSLEGGAFEYTLNALRKLGFDDTWPTLGNQMQGVACEVVIEMEAGQNDPSKLYPKLAYINPPGGGGGKPASGGLLSTLSQRAKAIVRPADAPRPAPRPAPSPAATPAQTEGNPF